MDFIEKGLRVIGIPKTIDNDLSGTDLTFGFMTAVDTATDALEKLHTTAESHHRIMVLEVMGRYAGWIALQSGIAGGADVILSPEIPYDLARVGRKIQERKTKEKSFSIIVVAEGAHAEDGEMVVRRRVEGSPDPVPGRDRPAVSAELENNDRKRGTGDHPRHLQQAENLGLRRILATRYRVSAVHLAAKGSSSMVSLQGRPSLRVPLDKEVTKVKVRLP